MQKFRATRVGEKIAVVIYSKTRKPLHQGFITLADLDRLQPLFAHYLNKSEVVELNAAINLAAK